MVAIPRVGTSAAPPVPAYSASTAGPASTVTELPARALALELNVTAATARGCTKNCWTAPTPAGRCVGSVTGIPASAAARLSDGAGWADPDDQVSVPKRSVLEPVGVEKPPSPV